MSKVSTIVLVSFIIVAVVLFICYMKYGYAIDSRLFKPEVHEKEIKRITSPDNKVDVVLTEFAPGAMSSFSYLIYLLPKDKKPSKDCGTMVFDSGKVKGLTISWVKDRQLLIQYREATIYRFQNKGYPFPNDYSYIVKIREEQVGNND